jgi:thioesterase domain-containing protein
VLVPVQPGGSHTPLFIVAAGTRDAQAFGPLAHALGNDQPIYVLQPPVPAADSRLAITIDGIVRRFVNEVQTIQPNGPYQIVGHSLGGQLAVALASQLQRNGSSVRLLALLDTPFFAANPLLYINYQVAQQADRIGQGVGRFFQQIANLRQTLPAQVKQAGDRLADAVPTPIKEAAGKLAETVPAQIKEAGERLTDALPTQLKDAADKLAETVPAQFKEVGDRISESVAVQDLRQSSEKVFRSSLVQDAIHDIRDIMNNQHDVLTDPGIAVTLQATQSHRPGPYTGAIHLLLASDSPVRFSATPLAWHLLASAGTSQHLVPGRHDTMLREPHVKLVAATLKDLIG